MLVAGRLGGLTLRCGIPASEAGVPIREGRLSVLVSLVMPRPGMPGTGAEVVGGVAAILGGPRISGIEPELMLEPIPGPSGVCAALGTLDPPPMGGPARGGGGVLTVAAPAADGAPAFLFTHFFVPGS